MNLLESMPGEKYLIVLTDGVTNENVRGDYWRDITAEAVTNKIAWTSIAVGADADVRLLNNLAQWAGGNCFVCMASDEIPQVFVREARAIKRLSTAKPKPFQPLPGPAVNLLKEMTVAEMPMLQGRVHAIVKPGADSLLLGDNGSPLLSQWQFGIGKVAAFTSDAKNSWAREWLSWKKYSVFWTQVIQSVLRPSHPFHVQVKSRSSDGKTVFCFVVEDERGLPVNDLVCTGKFLDAVGDDGTRKIAWKAVRPGEYEASVAVPADKERKLVLLSLQQGSDKTIRYCAYLSSDFATEAGGSGPDMASLEAIATAGAGLCTSSPGDIAKDVTTGGSKTIRDRQPLWGYLIILAISLWPVDLLFRRLFA
jgi:hypothetical protein